MKQNKVSTNDSISQAIIRLFEREMFYAEIVTRMRRIISRDLPAPAGVCIRDHIELHINPDGFTTPEGHKIPGFNSLTIDERAAVLKHECEHILRDHIHRAKEIAPDVFGKKKDQVDGIIAQMKHKAMNISMDCAINPGIEHIPDWACFPKNFNLRDGETFEWYLEQLKDNEKTKQLMNFDEHAIWGESEGEKEILKEKVRQAVNKAAERTRSAGRMTADNELAVNQLNKSLVNWKDQLKRFVARTITSHIESSKKKRNRRYGIMFPGTIKVEDLHIGVAMDTSGSISDNELTQFLSEISQIAKYAKVTVVEADTEVKNSYIFKPNKTYKVKGRGGTAYQPAFNWFNKMKDQVDGVIYFGDMDCFDTEAIHKPKYPVLWAIVGNQKKPADFGNEIRITKKGE